jgi:hypothetical protein
VALTSDSKIGVKLLEFSVDNVHRVSAQMGMARHEPVEEVGPGWGVA